MSTADLLTSLRTRAKAIAAEANTCCYRSDGYEEDLEELAHQHLCNAVQDALETCFGDKL